jgi:hypothetical protein
MKMHTEYEVTKLIRATINETAKGVFEWFEKETNIVDKQTRQILDDTAEIDINESTKDLLTNYVHPKLEKYGIVIEQLKKK